MKIKLLIVTLVLFICSIVSYGQSPNISYATPQIFGLGSPIIPLAPTNSGGIVPATIYSQVSTLAGSGIVGANDATGSAASFNYPTDVAVDAVGNTYVADSFNNKIRKITATGVVTTFAGNGTGAFVNGTGIAASFNYPRGIAVDAAGNLYVADMNNNRIRKITSGGVVTTLAVVNTPFGIVVDSAGNIYTSSNFGQVIYKITAAGVVTTLAGDGSAGSIDGTGTAASFSNPEGLAIDAFGNIYVADSYNFVIRKIDTNGIVTTLPYSFIRPSGVAIDVAGNIYVAEKYNNLISKIYTSGGSTFIAGNGAPDSIDGIGVLASFKYPSGLEIDASGTLYIADEGSNKIRKISTTGYTISPDLPAGITFNATTGVISGTATAFYPATDYIITAYNTAGSSTTTVNITFKVAEPTGSPQTFCNGATVADLVATGTALQWFANNGTTPLLSNTILETGTYYVSQTITGFESDKTAVSVTVNKTLPPTGLNTQVYAGTATVAALIANGINIKWYDAAIAGTLLPDTTPLVDDAIYYASQSTICGGGESIFRLSVIAKKISAENQTFCSSATISNLVGTPRAGSTAKWYTTASGGSPLSLTNAVSSGTYYVEQNTVAGIGNVGAGYISLNYPTGIAVQADSKILVADSNNNAIKRMDSNGMNSVILGNGFSSPRGIAIQADGKILVTDCYNHSIKRMDADGTNIVTLGSGFLYPSGIALQPDGKILVVDQSSSAVKRMDANGLNIEMLGSGFSSPQGIAVQADGSILVSDTFNNVIKKMNADGSGIVTLGSGFLSPRGVAIQADGKILVADEGHTALKRMNIDGTNIVTIHSTPYFYLHGVAVQADNAILTTYTVNNEVVKFIKASATNRVAVNVTVGATMAPTASAQTFCNAATVANLVAIGSGIQWYAAATLGTALVTTTALATGTYYASQTTICGESASRTAVAVTINTTPAPMAAAQTFCTSGTVANLVASGTALQWYANTTAGTALVATTALTTGTYYVTQTLNGCESPRSAVIVTINNTAAPMAAAQAFCNAGTVADLNATGTIIKWYANPSSTVALLGTTALATGTYYVTQTLNGCESARTAVIVTVNSTTAPIVSAQAFCHAATVANLAATGTAIKWYATATGGSTLVATTALTSGTYYVTQTLNGCESTRVSVAVTITSTTAPIVSAQAFCNAATVANLIATGTAIKWYANGMGGSPLVATTALATGTYYVSQSLNGCESGRSSVAVTINTTSAPMAAAQVFCNAATVANLVATGTTIKWYANPSSTSVLVGNTALATGTYYVTQTLNGCESARTAVAITINITAPPIIAAQTFCGFGSIASITVPETFPETTLAWYATASGGVALLANTTLNTGTYYATATTNGCESTRTAVSIIVNNTPVPLANAQTLCSTATVANLVASGTNLRWYATTTGASLAGTTLLTTGTYYVSQTVNICESPKTAVAVTITSNPSISYGTPNTYSVGTSISPLIPVNTGCPIPTSEVSTFAGSGAIGATDGTAASASFYRPSGVTVDATGNIYVVDTYNQKIRKITPAGVVSTFAGNGSAGATDGPAATASFYAPSGITIDAAGNIYVADIGSRKIRKITPAGIVSTIAGSGLAGSNDGLAANASFYGCSGVTVDASGNIYVADSFNNKIRKITPAGVVSTFAGNGSAGDTDGPAATASFSDPSGVTIDTAGIIYVADSGNNKIRKITPAGVVSTVAGSGVRGYTNGPAATAGFYLPSGVALDAAGNIYVADHYNQIIRKITSAGIVSTVAGINGVFGSTDGSLAIASFDFPNGVALDSSGYIYVADRQNNKIRKITLTSYEISPNLPVGLSFDSTTGIISGAPTATSPATNYVITAHTMGGTISTAVNISVGTLSTDSFEVKNNLKIYPNPATGNVTIELNNLNNAKLQVSDINGRILLNQKLDNTTVIDVSGFPSATYLFKVNSDQGTATSKVIKK